MSERTGKILIVDDEQNMRIALFEALKRNGYEVEVAENGRMALELLQKSNPDILITDIRMPEIDGLELLHQAKQMKPELPVVIITGYATINTAVEAMKNGAFDYIMKPFPVEVIENTVERVFANLERDTLVATAQPGNDGSGFQKPIIGEDERFKQLLQKAKSVASSKATVLILGESGTGKEIFARYIHNQSDRCKGPFVALNCAALPEGLLESELFGHEKGAFTGAIVAKKGKFELADGGTLLLDEIGEIPIHLQAKLLRVLQEDEVDRLGGKSPTKIDVHVVATTNRSLEDAVKEGTFRQDLYYRLNVIPLRLQSLRERKNDIPLLAAHFIRKYSTQYNKSVKKLSKASADFFLSHNWPGNVREMENLVERAVLLSTGDLLEILDFWDEEGFPGNMPVEGVKEASPREFVEQGDASPRNNVVFQNADGDMVSLREVERQMILQALQKTDNNRTHAAKMLGISVRTLRNKLNEYRNQEIME